MPRKYCASKYYLRVFACLILCSSFANAYSNADLTALKNGMPIKVKRLIDRQVACNHWGGEEPYDEARATEIKHAVEKLKCSTLEKDSDRLKKVYQLKPKVISAINKAKELY